NLQINRGDGTFAEATYYAGLEASEWSWGPIFLDVDLDGFEDILVTNGQLRDFQNIDMANRIEALRAAGKLTRPEWLKLLRSYPSLVTAKVVFRNRGNRTFEEKGAEWGFSTPGISQGMCLADLDGDGDLDVVVNNLNGAAGLYRNESNAPRVAVRLKGQAPNTRGIGAKIWLYGGAVPVQSQEMICGGRYLSGDDAMRVSATGSLSNEMRIEVRWRSGRRSVVNGVKANRLYELEEAGAEPANSTPSSKETPNSQLPTSNSETKPVFEDVSGLIGHVHHEEPYNDFERQPLLPRKLSQLGPGVGWVDVDEDGWEDLVIGSGRGGRLGVYVNDRRGGFKPWAGAPFEKVVTRDQTAVLGTESGLWVGSANYEDGLTNGGCVRIYEAGQKVSGENVLGQRFSVGPLAMADVDGDGELDLFVGGRVVAGRYPESADSVLLKNEGGRLALAQRFEKVGLVSGALFSDLDGDGQADLVLACEWGPVRVFHKEGGRFKEVTKELGMDRYVGWGNGANVGDLDGDGKMDIIASNWGLNSQYRTSREHPRKIYYGDMAGKRAVDVIEADYDEGMKTEVRERRLRAVGAALPFVKEKFSTYEAYGKASLQEIY